MARKEVKRKSRVVSGQIEEVAGNCQQLLAFQKFVEKENNGCFSTADPNSEASEGGACEVSQVNGFLYQSTANGGT